MLFTSIGANASTTVYFQNTGVPVAIQRGAGPRVSIHAIQSNPHYNPMVYRNNFSRPYRNPRFATDRFAKPRGMNPMNNNKVVIGTVPPRPVVNNAPVSRFDRGYQPRANRSYSRNGMVYYN